MFFEDSTGPMSLITTQSIAQMKLWKYRTHQQDKNFRVKKKTDLMALINSGYICTIRHLVAVGRFKLEATHTHSIVVLVLDGPGVQLFCERTYPRNQSAFVAKPDRHLDCFACRQI